MRSNPHIKFKRKSRKIHRVRKTNRRNFKSKKNQNKRNLKAGSNVFDVTKINVSDDIQKNILEYQSILDEPNIIDIIKNDKVYFLNTLHKEINSKNYEEKNKFTEKIHQTLFKDSEMLNTKDILGYNVVRKNIIPKIDDFDVFLYIPIFCSCLNDYFLNNILFKNIKFPQSGATYYELNMKYSETLYKSLQLYTKHCPLERTILEKIYYKLKSYNELPEPEQNKIKDIYEELIFITELQIRILNK